MAKRSSLDEVVRAVVREELAAAPTGWTRVPMSPRHCREAVKRGELVISRVGRAYYARALDLDLYMARHSIAPKVDDEPANDTSEDAAQLARDRALFLGMKGGTR